MSVWFTLGVSIESEINGKVLEGVSPARKVLQGKEVMARGCLMAIVWSVGLIRASIQHITVQ